MEATIVPPEDESPISAANTRAAGWEAALRQIEHQAEDWDTHHHGDIGHLIAEALRLAAAIARAGRLDCEHRAKARTDAARNDPVDRALSRILVRPTS